MSARVRNEPPATRLRRPRSSINSRLPTIAVHNAHRRHIAAEPDAVGVLIDGLGAEGDRLWPVADAVPIHIDRPLRVGSCGGHGPAAYKVVGYQPRRWLRMEFTRPRSLRGFHELSVHDSENGGSIIEHLLSVRLTPAGWLIYPIGLKAIHDQVIEKLLEHAELATTAETRADPVQFTRTVRLQLAIMKGLS